MWGNHRDKETAQKTRYGLLTLGLDGPDTARDKPDSAALNPST